MSGQIGLELLLRFGTLAGIYENLQDDTIRPKLREKLEAGREMAFLSYELATIQTDAPIVFDPEACRCQEPTGRRFVNCLHGWNLSLMARYDLHLPVDAAACTEPDGAHLAAVAGNALRHGVERRSFPGRCRDSGGCLLRVDAAENRDALQALLQAATPKYCHDCKDAAALSAGRGLCARWLFVS